LGCKRVAESIKADVIEEAFTSLGEATAAWKSDEDSYYLHGMPFWTGALLNFVQSNNSIVAGEGFSWSFVVQGPNISNIVAGPSEEREVPAEWWKDKTGKDQKTKTVTVFRKRHDFLAAPIGRNLEQIPQIVGDAIAESFK
jgi:hypothetical protein